MFCLGGPQLPLAAFRNLRFLQLGLHVVHANHNVELLDRNLDAAGPDNYLLAVAVKWTELVPSLELLVLWAWLPNCDLVQFCVTKEEGRYRTITKRISWTYHAKMEYLEMGRILYPGMLIFYFYPCQRTFL